uniref:Tetraspanin-6 n=1 Tax=Zea mays TaxID=4577 RepID=A0A804UGW4_MAIZE
MYPYRMSNVMIGYLNLATLLASLPIIGAGLWLARGSSSSSSTTCSSILQTPLLAVGFAALLVSLAGFVGACFHVAWALRLYLAAVALLVAFLLGLTAFGFAVTAGGGGAQVYGRPYREYRVTDYSAWLQKRMQDDRYFPAAAASASASGAFVLVLAASNARCGCEQSGCCKPPTACQYSGGMPVGAQDEDCYRWNNAPDILCYRCDSCRAGVMEQVRQDWHKIFVLDVAVLAALVCICSCGCCAFRNARRSRSQYPYGVNQTSKINPRWDYWWR